MQEDFQLCIINLGPAKMEKNAVKVVWMNPKGLPSGDDHGSSLFRN